jgi:hypothetical protein
MIEVELLVPDRVNIDGLVRAVEQICVSNWLTCTLKGTLASYSGCIHWHFKKGKQKGTLEVTWWESKHRLWFKLANGRKGEWIDESMPRLKEQIEKALY